MGECEGILHSLVQTKGFFVGSEFLFRLGIIIHMKSGGKKISLIFLSRAILLKSCINWRPERTPFVWNCIRFAHKKSTSPHPRSNGTLINNSSIKFVQGKTERIKILRKWGYFLFQALIAIKSENDRLQKNLGSQSNIAEGEF